MSRILLYQTQKFAISLVFSIMALIILFKVSFIFPWRTDNIYTFFFKNKNICLLLIFYKNNDNGYQQETEFFSAAVVAISMVYICTDRFIGDLYLWRFSHVLWWENGSSHWSLLGETNIIVAPSISHYRSLYVSQFTSFAEKN